MRVVCFVLFRVAYAERMKNSGGAGAREYASTGLTTTKKKQVCARACSLNLLLLVMQDCSWFGC
jgi:hypothetical protein